jgi:hypothetical protein
MTDFFDVPMDMSRLPENDVTPEFLLGELQKYVDQGILQYAYPPDADCKWIIGRLDEPTILTMSTTGEVVAFIVGLGTMSRHVIRRLAKKGYT